MAHLQAPERKTISGDDLAKMTERLTRPRKVPKAGDDNLLAKKIKISDEDLQKQLTRLYDQSIETKKRKMEKARKAEEKDVPVVRKLTEDEIAKSVQRQYTQALHSKKTNEEKLKRKFLFHPEDAGVSAKVAPRTKADIAALGSRLYGESRQHKEEAMKKLYEKYVDSTGPKKTYISTEEAKEAAARLCTPRGGGGALPPIERSPRTPRGKSPPHH